MSILIQVLEQGYSLTTPWEQRKYAFVDTTHVVTIRLDGQSGVWLDGTKHGESHRLAVTPEPSEAIFFLLRTLDVLAECRLSGGSWVIGHDGTHLSSIAGVRLPFSFNAAHT